jgi:N utilization substance protein B
MASRRESREWAVQLLFQLDYNPGELGPVFKDFWSEKQVTAKSRAFVEEVVRGVLDNRPALDALIGACAQNWSLPRMTAVDRNVIRLSTYEMMFRQDIPPAVSINEAVEVARTLGDVASSRFVNGLLDRVRREIAKTRKDGAPS